MADADDVELVLAVEVVELSVADDVSDDDVVDVSLEVVLVPVVSLDGEEVEEALDCPLLVAEVVEVLSGPALVDVAEVLELLQVVSSGIEAVPLTTFIELDAVALSVIELFVQDKLRVVGTEVAVGQGMSLTFMPVACPPNATLPHALPPQASGPIAFPPNA